MLDIIFLMSHVPNPRMNKRIGLLKQKYNVGLICIKRTRSDVYELFHDDITHEIISMDLPGSNKLFKRIIYSMKYVRILSERLSDYKPLVIYAEGLDSLLAAYRYKKKYPNTEILYEVADLRDIFIQNKKSFKKSLIEIIERRLIKLVDYLIVTSELFYEKHFCRLLPKEKMIFMPNMPDLDAFKSYTRKRNGEFTVGFIGGIRYLNQMKMLVDAAGKCGAKLLFAGGGGTDDDYSEIKNYCKNKNFVEFTGKYNYNNDIASLYGRCDVIYSVYDADNPNVKIALPNKLYEAVYCELPIIVAKETYLSDIVNKMGVGVAVSHKNADELVCQLRRLMSEPEYYQKFEYNCRKYKDYINIDKYNSKLLQCIKLENKRVI